MRFVIPADLTCSHCTLQWYYSTGNTCLYDGDYFDFFGRMQDLGWNASAWCNLCSPGATCSGTCCGAPSGKFAEEFWNCADIAVQPDGQLPSPSPQEPKPPSPTQTKPSPATSTDAPGECSAHWGQCGGEHWTGPQCCEAGSWCKLDSQSYSQCVPGQPNTSPTQQPSTCVQFCSLQNVTQAGCSAHSSDQDACLQGYITRGSIAIPCAWQSCGCFADGDYIQDCPDISVLCASMMQQKALRGKRTHQHRLSPSASSSMMFVEASRMLTRTAGTVESHSEL